MSIAYENYQPFRSALPVWLRGKSKELNVYVGLRAVVAGPGTARLTIAASSLYRFFVNGAFAGHGPARGPHGFFRVDEWDLELAAGANLVAIEVAGYFSNSYYLLEEPSFLQAELIVAGTVLAATASDDLPFSIFALTDRLKKVQRYSFQRPASEVYRLTPGWNKWRTDPAWKGPETRVEVVVDRRVIPRRLPYSRFATRQPAMLYARGELHIDQEPEKPWKDRSLTAIGPKLAGFPEAELKQIPSLEFQRKPTKRIMADPRPYDPVQPIALADHGFAILDLGINRSGFIGLSVACAAPCRVAVLFDELLTGGDVDFKRMDCVNILEFDLGAGNYVLESFEPYTARYLKIVAIAGAATVTGIHLREYVNPDAWRAHFAAADPRLNQVFAAGRETFAQNAVDILMDCPSRERAGWLCDSFFTARVAADLCGHSAVERNFLENFQLPAKFPHLPDGMLPMCYPADHHDGVFIANWGLWFVLQLDEYLVRTGDRVLVDALKARVMALFAWFTGYLNSDGLLEKLPGWVFVEWSKANSFTQDVNYPSNMVYAAALAAAARLYGDIKLATQSTEVAATIREQAFDGEFFVDNAVRGAALLSVTRNRSEVCQYYAFYCGIADLTTHAKLWEMLRRDFGPQRKATGRHPDIHPANAFIGNYLRLELLSRAGLCQQVLDESIGYLHGMAERTGTLWEHDGPTASCNHGFASHVVRSCYRDVLGLHRVDPVHRTIALRFTDLDLPWCEGRIPVGDHAIDLRWWREGDERRFRLSVPAGYRVTVENLGKMPIRQVT